MKTIQISEEIKTKCPNLRLGGIECDVVSEPSSEAFWKEVEKYQDEIRNSIEIESISSHPVNGATRIGYKVCGKKPGRYRPSAEALLRRVLQGKDLYRISNVVDMINLVSFSSGFSIGGYDVDKIQGDVVLGIGKENEPYEGLGRGVLNIYKLPVFRDGEGAFGSPTSDSERTGVKANTSRFLMIFLDFGHHDSLEKQMERAQRYLEEYCQGKSFESKIIEK